MSMTMAERRQATREQLLDAALLLFAERGIMAASAVQIATTAGFTRGAFHSHFTSKDELALAVLRRETDRYLHDLASVGGSIKPDENGAAVAIERALGRFLEAVLNDRTALLMRLEARLYAARVPEFREPFLQIETDLHQGVGQTMASTLARLGLELALTPSRAAKLVFLTYEQESLTALLEGGSVPSPQVRAAMLEVFTSIVRPSR